MRWSGNADMSMKSMRDVHGVLPNVIITTQRIHQQDEDRLCHAR